MVPRLGIGVAMAANTSRPPFATIADGVFATLMGKDPCQHPHLVIRERMKALTGEYKIHMGLEKLRVTNKGGLLYIEQKDTFLDAQTPLIPEDPKLDSLRFYTLVEGIKTPAEFVKTENGHDLYLERYRYHKSG
jgi:hypothetical protein